MKVEKLCFTILFALLFNPVFAQEFDLEASIQRGNNIYSSSCASCHMMNGAGINGVYPALAGADSLLNDIPEMLTWIIDGGEINGVSHSFSLTDREVSDLLNYIRNSWGNEGKAILPEEVQPALQESDEGD